ncbi:MAG TPA: DUF4147 domain-containing protein [Vicinamibacteria bacterium]|nr:DUF4147 domain-containing protein [Vicinamibacteria bacterium]
MTHGRQLTREIFRDTLAALDIPRVIELKLTLAGSILTLEDTAIDLSAYSALFVVAIGKAAHAMAAGLRSFLPDSYPFKGVVAAPTKTAAPVPGLAYFVAGHPNPNEHSWLAAEAIIALLRGTNERSVVFFLLSGGGSALTELPIVPGMCLEDLQAANHALVTCGAPIEAMNTVRRHLSAIKGGRLAVAAARATKLTLAVTDVPVGKEHALASGPTVPDPSTVADTIRIIDQYGLRKKFPDVLVRWLDGGKMPETPKPGDPFFRRVTTRIVGSNRLTVEAAARKARTLGFRPVILTTRLEGEAREVARVLVAILRECVEDNRPGAPPLCLLCGGETTVTVLGSGRGGRNQELAVAAVPALSEFPGPALLASLATDGVDGMSDGAGGVVDEKTLAQAAALGLAPPSAFLKASDSRNFLGPVGGLILTGPTGTNVVDLTILLAPRPRRR